MKTGYTPEQGRGFVRPCETEKQQNRGFSDIKKAAPIRSRLSEQLTYCAKNEYEQWDYINRVAKRHNCRITGKEKATCHGGQCDQCAGLLVDCQPGGRFLFAFKRRGYFSTKGSRANLSGTLRFSVRVNALFISLRVFSRWRMIIDNALFCSSWLFIIITFKTMRRSTSHHGASDGYSCSLAFLRWRRLISPRMAALINCPVLSPSSFTFSMPSIISWAIRAVTDCDFAFFGPVAMSNSLCCWCKTIYTKKNYFEGLTCKTLIFYIVSYTLLMQGTETTKPRTVGAVTGLLTTNDNESIEVAMRNHTTHPQGRDLHNLNKYIWRFIALSTAQPRVIHIVATSEQEARQQSPAGCVMVFAARIRQGVCHD
ncbi:host cell division inhibitor Icd-like protein [Escherichia coli]|nr:host cell division inhibitor Icd-like protein [Escherichia coli O17]EFH7321159.1 host cell division inhibitor Icd-like protein [Escherichia coli]EFL9765571.1 host cell division inhibitor Icd-like protein [Escherichia coli]EGO6751549.1 host cell division inhibitor Icd-like protein [Escherichia coli]EHP6133847.1 host cell division inhibitor Icd-like protein [Escherichia coli]